MWANAQRDDHTAEYRWRPLFARLMDGQNYYSQDRAIIAASHGNNNYSGTVSVYFTLASVFMIYMG